MDKKRILIVEDDNDIVRIQRFNFEAAGFDTRAISYGGGIFHEVRSFKPHLIVLDIMLPDVDGFEIMRSLRSRPETETIPVVMVTARDGVVDRISGLELGADDYVVKPFSPRELTLRVKAVLKRSNRKRDQGGPRVIDAGELRIDKASYRATIKGQSLELTNVEFKLLTHLVEHPGLVFTRGMLLEQVWGYNYPVNSRTVDTHIRRLRMKLGAYAWMIKTVRSVGYKFICEDVDQD